MYADLTFSSSSSELQAYRHQAEQAGSATDSADVYAVLGVENVQTLLTHCREVHFDLYQQALSGEFAS